MKERLRWLGQVLRVKDDRLSFSDNRPRVEWKDVLKKDLKEIGTSWEGVKSETLNRLGGRRSVRSCIGLKRLGVAVSC